MEQPQPTIDQRIEALTHSLELLHADVHEAIPKVFTALDVLATAQAKTERVMKQLAVFTIDHERRLRDIEGL